MKCPRCGFRNLAGTQECGNCGMSLSQLGWSSTLDPDMLSDPPADVFYPPRARFRRYRKPYRSPETITRPSPFSGITRTIARLRDSVRRQREGEVQILWMPVLLILGRSLVGILPGFSLVRLGQKRQGQRLLLAALGCLSAVLVFYRFAISNWALWALFGLMAYSIGATFFALWRRQGLPELSAVQCLGVWCIVLSIFFWGYFLLSTAFSPWWGLATMPNLPLGGEQEADALIVHAGDRFLYSSIPYWHSSPQRGDVILYETNSGRAVERVIGVEGDVVSVQSGNIFVNGVPLPVGKTPLNAHWRRIEGIFHVPPGHLWLVNFYVEGNYVYRQAQSQILTIPIEDVVAKVVAVVNPPGHRRWVR